jgi:hypothetical protein
VIDSDCRLNVGISGCGGHANRDRLRTHSDPANVGFDVDT